MRASTLAYFNIGGSPDSFIVPEKLLDKIKDDEEKVCMLELHIDYLVHVVSSRTARAAQR